MITPMPPAQSPRAGIGCLGSLVGLLVLVAVVVTVAFVGVIALGVVAALVVIGLVVPAADRLALALSPKRRARRAEQAGRARVFVWRSGFDGTGPLIEATSTETIPTESTHIETTATGPPVIDTTATVDGGDDRDDEDGGPGGRGRNGSGRQ